MRSRAMINREHGIGASEAPRGTLFHEYWVNQDGVLQKRQPCDRHRAEQPGHEPDRASASDAVLDGSEITEGLLNRIEAGIRCFDPCLSCSTHALGAMPLHVQLLDAQGGLISERVR